MQFLYFQFFKFMFPILKWMSNMYIPIGSKQHIFRRYYDIESFLIPGDVILSKSDGHLTNLTNLGYWKHAMIYVGGKKPSIVEAVGEGVVRKTLVEVLSSKDRIAVLRPTKRLIQNEEQMKKYISFVESQIGKPYDYSFDLFSRKSFESFYCSELVYDGIIAGNENCNFNLRKTFGISTVTPMDLYKMSFSQKFLKIIEISRKEEYFYNEENDMSQK